MISLALPQLTDRDTSIIVLAYLYGGVSIEHIRARFFPTSGARSACYTRIAKLVDAGYLVSQRLPSATGIGSGKALLLPGPAARPLLAKQFGLALGTLARRRRIVAPPFITHHLATCDVRLALDLAAVRSRVFTAMEWIPEWELRRRPLKVTDPQTNDPIYLVADGLAQLTLADGSTQSLFIEVDRDTEGSRIRTRLRGYLLAARSEAIPVLWTVPTTARADGIAQLARAEAVKLAADPTLFLIAQHDRIRADTVLDGPIWTVVGGPTGIALTTLAGQDPVSAPAATEARQAQGALS